MSRTPNTRARAVPWLLAATVVAVAAALLLARGAASEEALSTLDVAALHAALEGGATLVDVREPHEYEAGHVDGALLMPLARTVGLAEAEGLPKDEPVYVICRSGNRSLQAANALVEAGYRDVRNVDGGMIAWEAAGYPVVR